MKTYEVSGTMLVTFKIDIEAESEDEAREKLDEMEEEEIAAEANTKDITVEHVSCEDDNEP